MGRHKGGTNKYWTKEDKYKIIKPALDLEKSTWDITRETGLSNGMINNWIKKYREKGIEGLENKKILGIHCLNIQIRRILQRWRN